MRMRACRGAAALTVCLAAVLALCSSVLPASAQIGADVTTISFAAPTTSFGACNMGWAFQVTGTVTVDGLGFWDEASDGIAAHQVALWDTTNPATPLAVATITNGSDSVASASGYGNWLFESVADVVLQPGIWYAVAAVYSADNADPVRACLSPSFASCIAVDADGYPAVGSAIVAGDTLKCPEGGFMGLYGAYGPNVHFAETTSVPEPGSLALLGGLCVSTLLCGRRLKRRAK